MDQKGYRRGSFQSATSDEDMLEIAGAPMDFSMADDDPPLDREMGGNTHELSPFCFFLMALDRISWEYLLCGSRWSLPRMGLVFPGTRVKSLQDSVLECIPVCVAPGL